MHEIEVEHDRRLGEEVDVLEIELEITLIDTLLVINLVIADAVVYGVTLDTPLARWYLEDYSSSIEKY